MPLIVLVRVIVFKEVYRLTLGEGQERGRGYDHLEDLLEREDAESRGTEMREGVSPCSGSERVCGRLRGEI